jgi:hypothetical protein
MIAAAIFFAWFAFGLGFVAGTLWRARDRDDDDELPHVELLDRDRE